MATKVTPELEEMLNLDSAIERSYHKFNESETGSSVSTKNENVELEESILEGMTEEGKDFEDLELKERMPLENYNLKNKTSVSDGSEDKVTRIHMAEIEELEDKSLDETFASYTTEENKAFIHIANKILKLANEKDRCLLQERIRTIEKLEEQRKSSVSLTSTKWKYFRSLSSVAVFLGVSIAMVVIGSLYLKECPVQPNIPIYLVVGGAFGIFYSLISAFRQSDKKIYFVGIMDLFLLIWFILGCVWVYSVKHVEIYVTTDPDYCHQTCYNFGCWLLNSIFILIGALFGLACCVRCCGCLSGLRSYLPTTIKFGLFSEPV